MDSTKDYYAILGLLPSAEDFVIRAAYKALSQKYHPDKSTGDAARMEAINDAYKVLSSPSLRAQYDALRKEAHGDGPTPGDFDLGDDTAPDNNASDWLVATKYYPDLVDIERRLRRLSWRLATSYQALILDGRRFKDRKALAECLEKEFVTQYFG
ncbi:MAG: DnaJ domain-containing protein [Sinobacteraceae bacterium]|nr:DnaJ domain-containing protein [Nevskiaceae bacterium]